MALKIESTAFKHNDYIPPLYTCQGENMSPPLTWDDMPEGTKSIALICDDPDAPVGTFVHWVVYNIPVNATGVEVNVPQIEILPDGSKQGLTDFGSVGYGGPCPPPGKPHRYFFTIFALDINDELPAKLTKSQLESRIEGHVLSKAELIGLYKR